MVLLTFKCTKCGNKVEDFVKDGSVKPICPKCGNTMDRDYSGKCYGKIGECSNGTECTHNCATCKGCGK